MKNNEIEMLFKLPEMEEKQFTDFIRTQRERLISSPKDNAQSATKQNAKLIKKLLEQNQISDAIMYLREASYEQYLREESVFNSIILKELSTKFKTPHSIIEKLSQHFFNLKIGYSTKF